LQRFPKEICFAFSGVFFLLTLLVMFQSAEPFGIAAVVAYVACLTLTILLFSAPYFASYFINYQRKLHQIEEAIVILSEQRIASPVDDAAQLPPYSAVSVIQESEHLGLPGVEFSSGRSSHLELAASASDHATNQPRVDESQQNDRTTAEVEADADSNLAEPPEKRTGSRKRAKKKDLDPLLTSQDEFQLSLFDTPELAVSAQMGDFEEDLHSAETAGPLDRKTEIHAYLLLDGGNTLFLRGDAPFSWDKGTEMQTVDVGKYIAEPFEIEEAIEVCFLVNDNQKKKSARCRIEPSLSNECYPEI